MIYGVAIDAFYGIRQKRAYVCSHEGDGFWPLDGRASEYITGQAKPNYPMPTLIAETFITADTVAIYHSNRDAKILEQVWWKL